MKTEEKSLIEMTSAKNQRIARAACEYAYNHTQYNYHDIRDAYKNPSVAKTRAWEYCKTLCKSLNGFDLIISGKNCMVFSVCFKYVDKKTGALAYAYITRDYNRFCYQ